MYISFRGIHPILFIFLIMLFHPSINLIAPKPVVVNLGCPHIQRRPVPVNSQSSSETVKIFIYLIKTTVTCNLKVSNLVPGKNPQYYKVINGKKKKLMELFGKVTFAKHHNDDDDEPTLESHSNHAKINPNISGLATSFAFKLLYKHCGWDFIPPYLRYILQLTHSHSLHMSLTD